MNQILYVEDKKKTKKADIKNVIRFFSIAIMIWGLIFVSEGSYALYTNSSEIVVVEETKPTIDTQEIDGNLRLTVTCEQGLMKIMYHWNDEQDITIQGNNRTSVTEEIEIPVGENTLNIKIYDQKNRETVYQQDYEKNDLGESNIEFSIENNTSKMKITATDAKGLSYITYRWNNGEAQTVEADANDPTKIETFIEIPFGLNTLTVVAVNVDGVNRTKEQEIKGVKTTKVEAQLTEIDGQKGLTITLTDEVGIKSIQHNYNGTETYDLNGEGKTTFAYSVLLQPGENKIKVTIINNDDVKTEQDIIVNN